MAAKRLWTEQYRPSSLDSYVFQNEKHRDILTGFITNQDIPTLLLTGTAGSGKSTIAEILINELKIEDVDVLRVNASSKTGIDFIRAEIESFAESYPMGKFKIVKMEEFDRVSVQGQDSLKETIENNSDTCRFILTSNREHMIQDPIKSRVQHLRFRAPQRDATFERMCEILLTEEVEFDPNILDKYVDQAYPDIRKIINNLQLNTVNKILTQPTVDSEGGEYLFKLLDLITSGDLNAVRHLITTQCASEQLEECYTFLYQNINKHPKIKGDVYDSALLVLLDGIYKHDKVAIPHLNFEVCMIRLNQLV